VTATYPLAVLETAQDPELARQFVAFVLSAEGQRILVRWGLLPAQE
jgi:iron(III) transport system substrate-binding protein